MLSIFCAAQGGCCLVNIMCDIYYTRASGAMEQLNKQENASSIYLLPGTADLNFTKSSDKSAKHVALHQYLTYDFSFGSVVITTIAIRTNSTTILMSYTFYNTMKQKNLNEMKQKHNSHLPTLSCVHSPTVRKLQHLRATSTSTHQRGSCLYEMSYYISATARDPSLYVVCEQSLTYK